MPPTPKWVGKVEQGRLTIADREQFDKYLTGLSGIVELTVRKYRKNRSLEANAYLWGVCYKLWSESCGHTPAELHEICKEELLPPHQIMFRGKLRTIRLTTTKKDSKEFAEFVDGVIRMAAEDGVIIPPATRFA